MKLQDIILRISRLEFQPDNPRRGYFAEESNSWAVLNASEVVKVEEESPSQEVAGGEIVWVKLCWMKNASPTIKVPPVILHRKGHQVLRKR